MMRSNCLPMYDMWLHVFYQDMQLLIAKDTGLLKLPWYCKYDGGRCTVLILVVNNMCKHTQNYVSLNLIDTAYVTCRPYSKTCRG